jgi:hypothetical protein
MCPATASALGFARADTMGFLDTLGMTGTGDPWRAEGWAPQSLDGPLKRARALWE